jgi:sulfur relay protein TusB/DsrH
LIILSDYDVTKLKIALEILTKNDDKRVMLLSDALYLFNSETDNVMDQMRNIGARFIALDSDLNKRGINATSMKIIATSYEGLIDHLLEHTGSIVNL